MLGDINYYAPNNIASKSINQKMAGNIGENLCKHSRIKSLLLVDSWFTQISKSNSNKNYIINKEDLTINVYWSPFLIKKNTLYFQVSIQWKLSHDQTGNTLVNYKYICKSQRP